MEIALDNVRVGVSAISLSITLGAIGAAIAMPPSSMAYRALPIREEETLHILQTMRYPPKIRNVSLSPDGSKLFYEQTETLPVSGVRHNLADAYSLELEADSYPTNFWLLDLKTGHHQKILADPQSQKIGSFRIFESAGDWKNASLKPQWSNDGQQLGLLRIEDGALSFIAWSTTSAERQVTSSKIVLTAPQWAGHAVEDWSWSGGDSVTLFLSQAPSAMSKNTRYESNGVGRTWAWSASFNVDSAGQHASTSNSCIKMLVVDTRRGDVREKSSCAVAGVPEVVLSQDSQGEPNWRVISHQELALWQRDPGIEALPDNYLMRLLHDEEGLDSKGSQFHSRLQAFDQNGRGSRLYSVGPGQIRDVVRSRDGSLAYLQSTPEMATWPMDSEWGIVYRVDPETVTSTAAVRQVPLYAELHPSDRDSVLYEVDTLGFMRGTSGIFELSLDTGDRTRLEPENISVTSAAVSQDGKTIAAVLESVEQSPDIFIWRTFDRRWLKVTGHGEMNAGPAAMTHLSWRGNYDNFLVDGVVVKPPNFDPQRKYPLLVFVQGGTPGAHVRIDNRFDPFLSFGGPPAQVFANAGYVSLFVNHRGCAYSDFDATRKLVGHFGKQLSDVEAGVDALIAEGWVNPEQIGVIAHSHGADEMMYLLTHSRRYKAAMMNDATLPLPEIWLPAWAAKSDKPWDAPAVMRRLIGFDPVERIWVDPFQARAPLLIRWSANGVVEKGEPLQAWRTNGADFPIDDRAQTAKLLYAYQRNKIPIEVIIDRDSHWILEPENLLEWQSRMLQWFDYFLMDRGANPLPAMTSPKG